jgi:long-chain fatty acid transport protein
MKMNTKRRTQMEHLLFLSVLLLLPMAASAIGFRTPNQDPFAVSRGNAFAATADNPSAIYYNPAGIGFLEGNDLQIGELSYLGINTHYTPASGASSDTKFSIVPAPQIFYTYSPTNIPLSFGLGLYAPFGLAVDWPQDTGFRSIALKSEMQYLTINPVVAWKILPSLSVAAGPTFNYSTLDFTRGLASPSDFFKYDGSGFAMGFNAGVLWKPFTKWSVGANYRSASTMDYDGTTDYNPGPGTAHAPTHAHVPFPQIASGGISYRPTPDWNLEADVDWTGWSTLNTVMLKGTSKIFGADLPLQLNWHDSWLYEIGATRYLGNGWQVSAGYFYSGDSSGSKHFTPAIPDTVLHVGSLGFGHNGERWHWAVAGQIIAGPQRTINNSQPNPFTGESANGKYQLFVPTLSVSVGYHF